MLIPFGILSAAGAGGEVGTPAYEHIATAVPSGVSVTFSSIPQDYKHLQIRYVAKSTGQFNTTMIINFNGNTSAVYARHYLRGANTSVTSAAATSVTFVQALESVSSNVVASAVSAGIFDILDYSNTTKNTTIRGLFGSDTQPPSINLLSGLFNNTAAITSIKLDNQATMNTISRFSLYGIRG